MTDIKDLLRQAEDIKSSAIGGTAATDIDGAITELTNEKLAIDGSQAMTGGLNMGSNAITSVGNVDGRDVSADGIKLDTIETSATADQTGAEIKTAYELEADTNAFTDAQVSKLAGIETAAKDDQSAAEVAVTPSGNLGSTDVQAALQELQTDIDGLGGGIVWTIVTTNVTLSAGDHVFADTGTTARSLTLPITPSIGDRVKVVDYKANAATNNITMLRNGSNIESIADDLVMTIDHASAELVYSDATVGWVLVNV